LIETGFLTNPDEEKFLADTTGQRKMATAMFKAFEKYKNELEGVDQQTGGTGKQPVVEENKEPNTVEPESTTIVFRVQVETSDSKISTTASRFKGLSVYEYKQDNLYKYTIGAFENDYAAANKYKNELREKGFSNAFVVAFQNGERISLEKAIKLAKK
jgi:N-acetylmuramoyl-L-alanine amidase